VKPPHERRRALARLAASAAFAGGFPGMVSRALAKGDRAERHGIQRLEGNVRVGGRDAALGTRVSLGDRIETGADGTAVAVVGQDAFLLRPNTAIVVKGERGVLSQLLVESGRVLSVFAKKPVEVKASIAAIGIRGTGAYVEVLPSEVYFCLCYGEARLEGADMAPRIVKTTHHEQPLLLTLEGGALQARPGPFRNHTDAELVMLEALVGREPPFMRDGQYPAGKY